jgi:hypothetical protein
MRLLEINKAVNGKVKKALDGCFEYQVPIVAEDLSEPIIRPSVKIISEGMTGGKFNSLCKERSLTYKIYFFPKNKEKPKFENISMQEALESEFICDIEVKPDFIIPIEEVVFNVSDGILICSMSLYTIELLPDMDTNEEMNELKYRGGV